MDLKSDRRAFNRSPIELEIELSDETMGRKTFKERAFLLNISGEGAKFVTRKADRYFIDQQLDVSIHLPDSNEVKACMRGKATVVRIDQTNSANRGENSGEMGIALKFNSRLNFERIAV
jgi:hypothetical protein